LSDLPSAPYPAETRAKGWRFELDLEQIDQSDTWALTPVELRPWLLMLWAAAWRQTPCGSLPDDDALIAVRIGMKPAVFAKYRDTLLRGFWKAADGRLYHDTISRRVTEMLEARDKDRTRKSAYRERKKAERNGNGSGVPDMSRGTDDGRTQESCGGDDTRTSTRTSNSVPDGTDAVASTGLTAHEAIFQIGVPWLVGHAGTDVKESNIRSMLGGAEKHLKPEGAWQLVQDCMRAKPLQPVAWLAAAINDRRKVAPTTSTTRRGSPAQADIDAENAKARAILFGKKPSEVIDV